MMLQKSQKKMWRSHINDSRMTFHLRYRLSSLSLGVLCRWNYYLIELRLTTLNFSLSLSVTSRYVVCVSFSVAGYSSIHQDVPFFHQDEWNKWGEIRRRVSWMHVMNIKESPRNIREAMGRGKTIHGKSISLNIFMFCFFFVVVFVISCITTARHYLFIFLPNKHTHTRR